MRPAGINGLVASAITVLSIVAAAHVPLRAQVRPDLDLKAAMDKEVVDGDLQAAIEMYRRLTQSSDRAVRAKAWLRLGQCYEKLGNVESRAAYQRVVRDFADQKDVAEQARTRLAALSPVSSPAPTTRMVWTAGEDDGVLKVSRDGRRVAIVRWNSKGNDEAFLLRDLASGNERPLINSIKPDEGIDDAVVFSRDGAYLVYPWYTGSGATWREELRVMSLSGTGFPEPRRLLADRDDIRRVWPYDWSADGKWIAVAIRLKDGSSQLALVAAADGSVRVLKSGIPDGWREMALSPDGKDLAFDRYAGDNGARDVSLLATDTGREIAVIAHPADDRLVGWSPDGSRLIFTSDRSGQNDLWAQRLVDSVATGGPELLKADVGLFHCLGVSTPGALFSWVDNNRVSVELKTGTFDFSTGRWIAPLVDAHAYLRKTSLTPARNPTPDWSPDGKVFTYVAGLGPQSLVNANPVIVARSLDTDDVRQVRPKIHALMGLLLWTPDGTAFLGGGRDSDLRWGVYRIDARTGATSQVVATSGLTYVVGWSPDGKKLRYLAPGNGAIERNLATGEETTLLAGQPPGDFVGVSANGSKVYYRRTFSEGGKGPVVATAIVERDVPSGRDRELARVPATEGEIVRSNPAVGALNGASPDGRFVLTVVSDSQTSSTSLVLVPVATGQTRELMRVTRDRQGDAAPRNPALVPMFWAPDSRSILVNKSADGKAAELWWVPLDGAAPRRVDVGGSGEVTGIRAPIGDSGRLAFATLEEHPFRPYEVWVYEHLLRERSSAAKAR